MPDRENRYIYGAILLLAVFAVSASIFALSINAIVSFGAPVTTIVLVVSLLSLYGFYRLMTAFVGSSRSDRPTAN